MYRVSLVCTCCFSLAAFNILSLYLVFVSLISICLGVFLLGFNPLQDSLCLLDLVDYFLFHVAEIFNYNLFKFFLICFLLLFLFWDHCNSNIGAFDIIQRSLRLSSVLLNLSILFCSSEVISTILFSSSLVCSSASDILLLIPSKVFLISVIVLFVFVCLFFNS